MHHVMWIYEIILLVLGLSLVGYVIDVIQKNGRIKRIAYGLLCLAWALQTAVLVYEVMHTQALPMMNFIDVTYVYAWILLTLTLIVNRIFPIHFVELFTIMFTLLLLVLAMGLDLKQQGLSTSAHIIHEILIAHITFTILAYVFFTLSFFLSFMYLIQDKLLKGKKGLSWMWRLTDLKKLDAYSYSTVLIGVPLLSVGLLLGFVWAFTSGSEFYWMDMKTVGSMILLGIYVVYLLLRRTQGYRGKPISMFNSATFLVLLINFLLFNTMSNFHF